MAKRKRLTPAQPSYLSEGTDPTKAPGSMLSRMPIAQVAGETIAQAALQELSDVLEDAHAKGLMIKELPLNEIDMRYLVRDRLEQDKDEMNALMASLKARGQQMPIEVVKLTSSPKGHAYGLISGWRRMRALSMLYEAETEPRFGVVHARVIQPETAADAYTSMVEENEIRVNLSHYERARIAVKALRQGVFGTQKQALQALFGNATRSKRSKIGSFVNLVEALDDVLHHPASISEKLGLALAQGIQRDPDFTEWLRNMLLRTDRSEPKAELEVLVAAAKRIAQAPSERVKVVKGARPRSPQMYYDIRPGLTLRDFPEKGRVELTGEAVNKDLVQALVAWLSDRKG